MAPTIVAVSEFFQTTSSSASWAVDYPAPGGGILANDILIVRATQDQPGSGFGFPGSWTTIATNDAIPAASTSARAGVAWIRAAGGESGTFTVTLTAAERGTAQVLCIRDAHTTTAPEFGAHTHGNSTDPNPASLTASWGAEDNLWIPFGSTDGATVPSAAPTNYSGLDTALGDASGASTWHSYRANNTATEDAGVYTQATEQWGVRAIVVRPAPVGGDQTLSPGGRASTAAFGTATVVRGEVIVSPSGIASGAVFGTAALAMGEVVVSPAGIASGEAFGLATVEGGVVVIRGGIELLKRDAG